MKSGMESGMKLRDTIKLYEFAPKPKWNKIALVFFSLVALVYLIPMGSGQVVLLGAFWVTYPMMYMLLMITQVIVAGYIQSSEKVHRGILRNMAVLMEIYNLVSFVLFVVLRTWLAFRMQQEEQVVPFLAAYCFYMMLYAVYVVFMYKKPVVGYILLVLLCGSISFGYQSFYAMLNQMTGSSIYGMIAVTAVVCVLTPVLYYGLSLAMDKYPYSELMLNRIMRQKGA